MSVLSIGIVVGCDWDPSGLDVSLDLPLDLGLEEEPERVDLMDRALA